MQGTVCLHREGRCGWTWHLRLFSFLRKCKRLTACTSISLEPTTCEIIQIFHSRQKLYLLFTTRWRKIHCYMQKVHGKHLRMQKVKPQSNILNRSALLCPWSQLFSCCLPHLLNLLFAALSASPGCLPWPVLSTEQRATHTIWLLILMGRFW